MTGECWLILSLGWTARRMRFGSYKDILIKRRICFMKRLICLCVNALLLAGSAAAQNQTWTLPAPTPDAAQVPEPGTIFFQEGPGTPSFHAANGQATFFHYEIAGSQE